MATKKKTAPKKAVKKTAPKKATKKTAPKKAVKKTAPKKVAKKTAPKKVAKKSPVKKIVKTTTTTVTTTITNKVPTETHYLLVLDESGSMQGVRQQTLDGVNEQIQQVKRLEKDFKGQKYFISVLKFSNKGNIEYMFQDIAAKNVKELTLKDYNPNGGTALLDAIGKGTTDLKTKIQSKIASGDASALVVVLTDGEENDSVEWGNQHDSSKIKALIEGLEITNLWTFTFIGASQKAVLDATSRYGFARSNSINYTASVKGTRATFNALNDALYSRATSMSVASAGGASFSNDLMSNVLNESNSISEDYKSTTPDADPKDSNDTK
jgi:uncharacterized protein YegL